MISAFMVIHLYGVSSYILAFLKQTIP